jgi:hypothetical protein
LIRKYKIEKKTYGRIEKRKNNLDITKDLVNRKKNS